MRNVELVVMLHTSLKIIMLKTEEERRFKKQTDEVDEEDA
jgi:hypothetical protein